MVELQKKIILVSSSKDNNTRVFMDGGAGTVGAGERQSSGRVVGSSRGGSGMYTVSEV